MGRTTTGCSWTCSRASCANEGKDGRSGAVRAFLPNVSAAQHCRVIAISTPVAGAPTPGHAPYAATKAAVEALIMSVGRDLAGTTATANVLLVRAIGDEKPNQTRPEELAAAMAWLVSPEAGRRQRPAHPGLRSRLRRPLSPLDLQTRGKGKGPGWATGASVLELGGLRPDRVRFSTFPGWHSTQRPRSRRRWRRR